MTRPRRTTADRTVPVPNKSMAKLVGLDEFDDGPTQTIPALVEDAPEPCPITYMCEHCVVGTRCAKCDGTGTRIAHVTPRFVRIDDMDFERGQVDGTTIEDLETISEVCDRVDEECRPYLAWLLHHGAPECAEPDPSPQMRQLIAIVRDEPPAHVPAGSLTEAIISMLSTAIQQAGAGHGVTARDQCLALAQLRGRREVGKGGERMTNRKATVSDLLDVGAFGIPDIAGDLRRVISQSDRQLDDDRLALSDARLLSDEELIADDRELALPADPHNVVTLDLSGPWIEDK